MAASFTDNIFSVFRRYVAFQSQSLDIKQSPSLYLSLNNIVTLQAFLFYVVLAYRCYCDIQLNLQRLLSNTLKNVPYVNQSSLFSDIISFKSHSFNFSFKLQVILHYVYNKYHNDCCFFLISGLGCTICNCHAFLIFCIQFTLRMLTLFKDKFDCKTGLPAGM